MISAGGADLAPIDDRDDCLANGEVNHPALFLQVVAVVDHGGAGTTTAARAGAPQVVVPQITDRPTGLPKWPTWASARHTRPSFEHRVPAALQTKVRREI